MLTTIVNNNLYYPNSLSLVGLNLSQIMLRFIQVSLH